MRVIFERPVRRNPLSARRLVEMRLGKAHTLLVAFRKGEQQFETTATLVLQSGRPLGAEDLRLGACSPEEFGALRARKAENGSARSHRLVDPSSRHSEQTDHQSSHQ